MKLSCIIPAFKEPYLQKTVTSLLGSSELGDQLEVIVVLDGPWLETPLNPDPRLKVIQLEKNVGMRGAINTGLGVATGEFIMKCDAHCCFGQGFDRILTSDCKEDWLMIPRRYSLNENDWIADDKRHYRDYHYLCFPERTIYGYGMEVTDWSQYNRDHIVIDDTMIFQGSFWLANRNYFMNRVGLLDDSPETYGPFAQEQLEIGLKYWLGGGAVKINKRTWYAHLSKRQHHYDSGLYDRSHKKTHHNIHGHTWASEHWLHDQEPGMMHKFEWLVNKFFPIPRWPDNWKELI